MTRIESELHDLYECLMRNDDMADSDTYYAIVGIANDAAEVESENEKLRELVRAAWRCIHTGASCSDCRLIAGGCTLQTAMRELGVEVDW